MGAGGRAREMKHPYAIFGGVLTASFTALQSCSNFTDCTTRRDCPSDFNAVAGSENASGGASGKAGASGTSGTSGTNGEGGSDTASAGTGGAPPPPCDGTLSPGTDACVISDEFGIFVSATAEDSSADGTQAHPFATLTTALTAIDKRKHVYVCAADYAEPGTLEIPD